MERLKELDDIALGVEPVQASETLELPRRVARVQLTTESSHNWA